MIFQSAQHLCNTIPVLVLIILFMAISLFININKDLLGSKLISFNGFKLLQKAIINAQGILIPSLMV